METFSITLRGIHFTSAAGLTARERVVRLGSELSGSVIDSQTTQNLIDTAIQFIPMAKSELRFCGLDYWRSARVLFLTEGEQTAEAVMARLATFLGGAKRSLNFAFYDMRLSDSLKNQFSAALKERAAAGVEIRICFDGDKPLKPNLAAGQDPAPPGTSAFVQSLGYPWRRIAGMKLMHHKFLVRDAESVWTGSLNLTYDAFTLMENNIVEINLGALALAFAQDFEQLWQRENFDNTGEVGSDPVALSFSDQPATVRVMFSPVVDSQSTRRSANASALLGGASGFAVS